jgi:hypothetical protein
MFQEQFFLQHQKIIDQPDRFFDVITCPEKLFCGLISDINNSDR